ncbi:MAG: DnaJ domain-containing protein [Chloroflexota bacterium]|nr:DnaJ domain-containing protein [Chloroflexota bacterium]
MARSGTGSRGTGSSGSPTQDHYAVLGLRPDASAAEVRVAFRRLAREFHPDVNSRPDAAERFRDIVAAYEVLSDPVTRAAYDARPTGRGGTGTGPARGGTSGRAYGRGAPPGGGAQTQGPARASQTQASPPGRPAPPGGPRAGTSPTMPPVRGLDRHSTLRVPATLLEGGGTTTLDHRRWERCPDCAGLGRLQEEVPCPVCGGSGFHGGRLSDPSRACWGSGTTTVCPTCSGKGGLWRPKHLEVTVPAGACYGRQLRLRGMGDAGPRGGPPGELYLELAPPLPAAVQAVASHELVQAALRRLEEWLDRFAPYPAS